MKKLPKNKGDLNLITPPFHQDRLLSLADRPKREKERREREREHDRQKGRQVYWCIFF